MTDLFEKSIRTLELPAVLEKLAASYRAAELKVQERNDQRVLDDLGARAHGAKKREENP